MPKKLKVTIQDERTFVLKESGEPGDVIDLTQIYEAEDNEFFEIAKEIYSQNPKLGTAQIQRRFHIGYARAYRLLDRLHEKVE